MNKNNRSYLHAEADTVTNVAADKWFTENLLSLSTIMESIAALDGAKAQVKSIRINIRMYSGSVFGIVPLIVQTAGAFTDNNNIAFSTISSIDDQIDDIFGFQILREFQMSRRVPTSDPTVDTGNTNAIETTLILPQNIVQILNKESETERLQDLYLGFVGWSLEAKQTLVYSISDFKYNVVAKRIILR